MCNKRQVCGKTKKHKWRRQTWWWNDVVNDAIQKKRKCYNAWKKGGSRAEYNIAKKRAKKAVYAAKQEAEKSRVQNIDPNSDDVYRIAKQMKWENQDVVGDMCVRNDAGALALDDDAKKKAWQEHYERLLNVEFPWVSLIHN